MNRSLILLRKHSIKLATLFGVLLLWQLVVTVFGFKEFVLPSPLTTFSCILSPSAASKYEWFRHIRTTLVEIAISFLVTAGVGIGTAILITWSAVLRKIITPIIALFNSLPKIALAPLFLLWFGYGIVPNIMIGVLIAFFPVVINTATGLNAVEEDLLDLVRYLHATKWQVFVKIRIPNSLPYIFSGFKISATLCVVGAIVGEFVASNQGLGYLIKSSQGMMDTPPMFASLILISLMGLGFFGAIAALERVVMPWQGARQGEAS
jgi:NitT/TauT family transport system permease protein